MDKAAKASEIEKKIQEGYERFGKVAEKFGFVFTRSRLSAGSLPNVLMLGNHSAGKSTWINYLLKEEKVQDTGVAPTDDGFTIIVYGEKSSDLLGPAALRSLPSEFGLLERLGPNFLRRFKVKKRPCELLKTVNLIDSPGMIDAARSDVERDYNFQEAVRRMAEFSDIIFFLFDPDKPGTTSEALQTIEQTLTGMHFKLRFLMNKADTYENMHDFTRAYGALCWNLARVLSTKDLPIVHTTYVPVNGENLQTTLNMTDFDQTRENLVEEIKHAGERREDNILALARQDLTRLALHVRVSLRVRRDLLKNRFLQWTKFAGATFGGGALVILAAHFFGDYAEYVPWLLGILAGVIISYPAWRIAAGSYTRRRSEIISSGHLDEVMRQIYAQEMVIEQREDIEQGWDEIREQTHHVLEHLAEGMPLFAFRLKKLDAWLSEERN